MIIQNFAGTKGLYVADTIQEAEANAQAVRAATSKRLARKRARVTATPWQGLRRSARLAANKLRRRHDQLGPRANGAKSHARQ